MEREPSKKEKMSSSESETDSDSGDEAGGLVSNDSNAEQSTSFFERGYSCRRAESVRGGLTDEHVALYPRLDLCFSSIQHR